MRFHLLNDNNIQNHAIKLAECDSVPRIMIIFGQNGVCKSTLLYAIKQSIIENVVKEEDVIFISPLGK
jgi:predicted ATPase